MKNYSSKNRKIIKIPKKYWIPASIAAALVTLEVSLRLAFGLGSPALSQADSDTGYRFVPNQNIFRFGKRIKYNQYSQRSEPITPEKPQGVVRILMTGDSVLNGGNPTDQAQIISEQLKTRLSSSGKSVEVLNASAGSWGIGNQQGYLRKFGIFQSNAVILQIGSHDLTQPTSTSAPVGHNPNYPDRPPVLATQELITRYILPRLFLSTASNPSSTTPQVLNKEDDKQFQENIQQFKAMVNLIRAKKVPVFVLFTPNREDLIPTPKTPKYKSKFLQVLKELQIPVFDTHTAWSSLPTTTVQSFFRDDVHLNEAGNQAAVDLISKQLCTYSKLQVCS
ncbi:SGNH/GDSL hydrolase family protein [Tolypothrix campylonemoides VB511288]|nr:SGNH/GDSL hydrolase family protein [Tolypothrix campylonemoides VB511288]